MEKCLKALLLALCFALCLTTVDAAGELRPYGVFIGLSGNEAEKLDGYETVVVEPTDFSAEQFSALKAAGKRVYVYLNIGTVEEYRPYYRRFQPHTMGVYGDWPDEHWMDAAFSPWQDFVIHSLGARYAALGADGFFIDNTDIYDVYPTEDIFRGLCHILTGLRTYNLPVVINGGDVFVSRCIGENTASALFDGVNQECVFTSIDFEHDRLGVQRVDDTLYFQKYLSDVKAYGLSVWLLEYAAPPRIAQKIDAYCTENGFLWYNAPDIDLR